MEYVILLVGLVFILAGMLGSFLPILPGPPLSWLGLMSIYLIPETPFNYWLIGVTFIFMIILSIADFLLPGYYSKRKGGSKYASWGSTLGLVIGLIFFPPIGLIIGAFLGAFLGELIFNRQATTQQAYQSALGTFVGFIASTFMKFVFCSSILAIYIYKIIEFRDLVF